MPRRLAGLLLAQLVLGSGCELLLSGNTEADAGSSASDPDSGIAQGGGDAGPGGCQPPSYACGQGCCPGAIAAGGEHSCATNAGGAVLCWGKNTSYALGDGTTNAQPRPHPVSGLSAGVVALSAGYDGHTCAITTSGALLCWGYNFFGEVGNNTHSDVPTPTAVMGLSSGVGAVAAGANHTCAVVSGAAKCWGMNNFGQLGNGLTPNPSYKPYQVPGLTSGVVAVAAGERNSCAVTDQGALLCWGTDQLGELGDGLMTQQDTPYDVPGLQFGVASVAFGQLHACAAMKSGAVQCWGYNSNGQIGDGSVKTAYQPTTIKGLSGAVAVSAGTCHSCALLGTGEVSCWGCNAEGELGDGSTVESHVPVMVKGLSGVIAISVGWAHTCARKSDGSVWCWGDNSAGQVEAAAPVPAKEPWQIQGL